jgi:hypothetical protein
MATEETHRGEKPETPQVSTRAVILNAGGILLLLAFAIGVLDVVYYRQVSVQSFPAPEKFPRPRVETGQRVELHHLEAAQRRRLDSYRWVDHKQGLIEIPIDRAMQILAAEGEKAYQPLAPASALATPSAGAERLITSKKTQQPSLIAQPPALKPAVGAAAKPTEGAAAPSKGRTP